ncbi:MAG TPA: phosphopantothenoylcysteine decarboxylase [Tepidisphaeraceae bacterium]|nr:phosphopantothenoylcysteine decarboxylase [Tepidisphaeraceae bacterium]
MRCLVTAGNTREKIDRVRDWGNVFTGNTGLGIARALTTLGGVDLLTSNQRHLDELEREGGSIEAIGFSTHAMLKGELAGLMSEVKYDAVFMTAAVADYRPSGVWEIVERVGAENAGEQTWKVRRVSGEKVSSAYKEIAVVGKQTEKIVDLFRGEWRYGGLLVKFKLEVGLSKEELIAVGRRSREASGADYLVANTLEMVEGENAGAYLIGEKGEEWVARGRLAERMVELVRQRYAGGAGR